MSKAQKTYETAGLGARNLVGLSVTAPGRPAVPAGTITGLVRSMNATDLANRGFGIWATLAGACEHDLLAGLPIALELPPYNRQRALDLMSRLNDERDG